MNTTVGASILNLGASATNNKTIWIRDSGAVADTAYVDITGGTAASDALRLQGCRPANPTTATVSTNLGTGGGGILHLTSGYNDGAASAISISDTTTTMNRVMTVFSAPKAGTGYSGITQQLINGGANIGTTPFTITNPTLAGLYTILVRVGDNAAININGQINSVGYWDGSIWVAGGTCISPPLGTGNLYIWFGESATSRSTLILENTGSAQLSGVAVYIIPQLVGALPIT